VLPENAISRTVAEVEGVALDLGERVRLGLVQSEDDFTIRLVDRIEHQMNGQSIAGVEWRAIKLTDRGPGAQEAEIGADLLGILIVKTPEGSVAKGFLAQAKLSAPGRRLNRPQLAEQADRMLQYTPDAFVFRYYRSGIRVIPALPVARTSVNPWELPSWGLSEFFGAHLRSFVGDERLGVSDREPVEALRREFRARHALVLEATVPPAEARGIH
jgi:hypothetical protein